MTIPKSVPWAIALLLAMTAGTMTAAQPEESAAPAVSQDGLESRAMSLVSRLKEHDSLAFTAVLLRDERKTDRERIALVKALETVGDSESASLAMWELIADPPPTRIESSTVRSGGTTSSYPLAEYYKSPVREAAAEAIWRIFPIGGLMALVMADSFEPGYREYVRHIVLAGARKSVREFITMMDTEQDVLADLLPTLVAANALDITASDSEAVAVVPALIRRLGAVSGESSELALKALKKVTGQDFGADQHAWNNWWQQR